MSDINKSGYLSVPIIWGDEEFETREELAEDIKPGDLVSFENGDHGNVYVVWSVDEIPVMYHWSRAEFCTMYRLNCNQGATAGPMQGDRMKVVSLSEEEYRNRLQSHYLRWVLSEALKRHGRENIFIGTEHVSNALRMSRNLTLSGEAPWGLDKIELRTLVIGLRWWDVRWHQGQIPARKGYYVDRWPIKLKALYEAVEKDVREAHRAACHADGATWI